MRTSGLLIRRARVRVPPSPSNESNEIAESVSSDTVSVDTSQSAASGATCPNTSHTCVTVAPDDRLLEFMRHIASLPVDETGNDALNLSALREAVTTAVAALNWYGDARAGGEVEGRTPTPASDQAASRKAPDAAARAETGDGASLDSPPLSAFLQSCLEAARAGFLRGVGGRYAPPFAGGRRLERVRCDACDGAGWVDGPLERIECCQCRGRKFVWVVTVDEGGGDR